jgi:hypothetical protein
MISEIIESKMEYLDHFNEMNTDIERKYMKNSILVGEQQSFSFDQKKLAVILPEQIF